MKTGCKMLRKREGKHLNLSDLIVVEGDLMVCYQVQSSADCRES